MRAELINEFVRRGLLRKMSPDVMRAKSLFEASIENLKAAKEIPIKDKSATLVFREMYESIRQLGDTRWWLLGYEAKSHELSMEILREMEIKNGIKLQFLDRFRQIRNDANYRGYRVTLGQAKEIVAFWDSCGDELASRIKMEIDRKLSGIAP